MNFFKGFVDTFRKQHPSVVGYTYGDIRIMALNLIKVFYNLCSSIFAFNAFLVLFNKMEGMGIENLGLWIHAGAFIVLHC